jgi:hypothetical protein
MQNNHKLSAREEIEIEIKESPGRQHNLYAGGILKQKDYNVLSQASSIIATPHDKPAAFPVQHLPR